MAKFRSIKNSFLGGQISPTCVGRTDLPQYPHSCEILQNMIPMLSGGAYRRPGTLNMDTLSAATEHPPRLLDFVVSRTESYAVMLGHNGGGEYAKVYRATGNSTGQFNGSAVTGTPPYVRQTIGSYPGSLGTGDDEVFDLQYCQSADVMYLSHPAHKPQLLRRTATDTFVWSDFDTDSSGTALSGQALVSAYPYLNQNTTSTTMAISTAAVGTGRTLTASAAYFTSDMVGSIFQIFGGTQVGACQVTAFTDSTHVTAKVLVAFDDTSAHATWWESAWSNHRGWPRSVCIFQQRLCFGGTLHQPDTIWFSQTAGYSTFSTLNGTAPASTVIVRGASITVAGGNIHYPVDDSEGDGQTTGPTGIQPFRITLSQNQLDQIQWLSPDKELLVGTLSQEWIISPQNGSFDISNSPTVLQSKYGSDYLMPSRIGYELIFPLNTQDEVRAYQYNYIDASFFAEPVQLLFDQYPKAESKTLKTLGRRKFRWIQWDVTRQTLWCIDTVGNFFGMTRDRKLQITMWHTHQLGGFDSTKGVNSGLAGTDPAISMCDGSVVSFTCVPNPFSGVNDVWMVVKRTVSGVTNYQIERMMGKNIVRDTVLSTIVPGTISTEPLLVDAATIQTDNGDGTFVYTQGAFANGYSLVGTYYSLTYGMFKITTGVVSGGSATLNTPLPPDYGSASPFHAFTLGLPYTSIIQPSRIDAGSVIGTSQGAIKRINRAFIRFFKTIGAKIGSIPGGEDTSGLEMVVFNPNPQLLANSPEVFTGDKKVIVPSTYDRDGYLYLIQDQPLPFTVVSIVAEGEEFD